MPLPRTSVSARAGEIWPTGIRSRSAQLASVKRSIRSGCGGQNARAAASGLGLASLLTWVIVAYAFRYSSLASMVTAIFAPAFFLFGNHVAWTAPAAQVLVLALMALLLIWRHSENINRLLAGKESKLGAKKS